MGQRLEQIRSFAAGRRLVLAGRLGGLGSRLEMAVDEAKAAAAEPAGRLFLLTGDGRSLVELLEEEIAQVLPQDGGRSLLILLDGGMELLLRPAAEVEGARPTMVE